MRSLLVVLLAAAACRAQAPVSSPAPSEQCRCTPDQACWPSSADWQRLQAGLQGKLETPAPAKAEDDPFLLQQQSGATQSRGWLDAWTSKPSAMAIAAQSAADVAAGVRFAAEHNLRVVIKGTGHDYLGRSSAPGSLLIWTHPMRRVTIEPSFTPQACTEAGLPAVSIEAGARWGEVYDVVSVQNGRYVQGGGCTSVGAAGGFLQGGGFGSFSKKFGVAAAGMLEAEVVTAAGQILIANRCQNRELFWALRGGGGGTFGVVTRVTLMTHPLPSTFGGVFGRVDATSDEAYRELLIRFIEFYRERLNNEHWGEQVSLRRDNSLHLSVLFAGLTREEAIEVWAPFRAWIEERPGRLSMKADILVLPPDKLWDADFLEKNVPGAIARSRAGERLFFWASNRQELSAYWYAYGSRWLPIDQFQGEAGEKLAGALFAASREWTTTLHLNKGQAGAAAEAVARGRDTSMNPAVFRAAALVIIAALEEEGGDDPKEERARVQKAIHIIRYATPGAGAYVNEADYFEPAWQESFWGENYPHLLQLKTELDPRGLFFCHHCVGSEQWSDDGMCRRSRE